MSLERRRERERHAQTMEYASPAGMILEATAARLDGDWRAACAAANVDVDFHPERIRVVHGAENAALIEDDLAQFAPDLLRRHLPRDDTGALWPGCFLVLSRPSPGVLLTLRHPEYAGVPQRLRLGVSVMTDVPPRWLELPAWTWRADAVAERRWAYGASDRRLPWHHADGTPYAQGILTPREKEPDRATEFERIVAKADKNGWGGFRIESPLDAALLRWGVLTPDQLHPLVHEALFPGRVQDWQPLIPEPYGAYRVRCGKDWHIVEGLGAGVCTPFHDEAEQRREETLGALGGQLSGCAAAVRGFRTGVKPVPKEIRKHRQRIFGRAFHGDTDGLLADLAAGCDPELRDSRGRTLVGYLAHVDASRVGPVLQAAGVSAE